MKQEWAGRTVLGLALIAGGLALLMMSMGYTWVRGYVRLYWPVVFIALGLEILWRQWRADRSDDQVRVSIDVLSLILIVVLSVMVWGAASAGHMIRFVPR